MATSTNSILQPTTSFKCARSPNYGTAAVHRNSRRSDISPADMLRQERNERISSFIKRAGGGLSQPRLVSVEQTSCAK